MARDTLTDEQWERLCTVLPPQKPKAGRPAKDHRPVINGILWILRTGAPWRDLPTEYGSWQTIATRFYRWVKAGVWDRVLSALQRQAEIEGTIDWTLHHVDGTTVRAHQHAAGAEKRGSKRLRRRCIRMKRWGAVRAASAPRSTCEQRATARLLPS